MSRVVAQQFAELHNAALCGGLVGRKSEDWFSSGGCLPLVPRLLGTGVITIADWPGRDLGEGRTLISSSCPSLVLDIFLLPFHYLPRFDTSRKAAAVPALCR